MPEELTGLRERKKLATRAALGQAAWQLTIERGYAHTRVEDIAAAAGVSARTFSNSLDWQRKVFGWVPSQRTTVWLRDFADYGNAGVSPAPNTLLRIDVAPPANAFETNPSSERMYSTMNHEMVHVATTDIASSEDRRWREIFLGKVAPQTAHPESLLYSYLTVPRFTVPRPGRL